MTRTSLRVFPVINDSVNFTVAPNGMGMTANGTAYIKTPFLQFAAVDKLPLISTSQTDFSKSEIAIGGKGSEIRSSRSR